MDILKNQLQLQKLCILLTEEHNIDRKMDGWMCPDIPVGFYVFSVYLYASHLQAEGASVISRQPGQHDGE